MRLLLSILLMIFFMSCSSKYKGIHTDYNKFSNDIDYCLKKACNNFKKSFFQELFIISPLFAYGGGNHRKTNKISYIKLNLCLKEKGYVKDKSGMFELPFLSCN